MHSNTKWQSSMMQNSNYFCTNLIILCLEHTSRKQKCLLNEGSVSIPLASINAHTIQGPSFEELHGDEL